MGWSIVLVSALIALALLGRFGRLTRSSLELAAAALVVAVAGYAWQGSPNEAGTSVTARETASRLDPATVQSRIAMMGEFGSDAQWLGFSDTMLRMGSTQGAVLAMRSGIRDYPRSSNLWVGLGNALVAHGEGIVSPAARFAFARAAQLSPKSPAPPFFFALALAQEGRADEATRIWRTLLARSPADAPWRADVERRIAVTAALSP